MKRPLRHIVLTAPLLSLALALTACGGDAQPPANAAASSSPSPSKADAGATSTKTRPPKGRGPSKSPERLHGPGAKAMGAPRIDFDIEPPKPDGLLVRVYKRHITTGVISVLDERAVDQNEAHERLAALRAQGYRPWPPPAAPELAAGISTAHPALRDCPYLMAVSDLPKGLLGKPRGTITCFSNLHALEEALEREAVIQYQLGQALPCMELRSVTLRESASPRVRELRARCRNMGIVVSPLGLPSERSPAVQRRSHRNRSFKTRIRQ